MFRSNATKTIAVHLKNRSSRNFKNLLYSESRPICSQYRAVTTKMKHWDKGSPLKSVEKISVEAFERQKIESEEPKMTELEAKQQADLLAQEKLEKIDKMRNRHYNIAAMETFNIVAVLKIMFSTKEEMHKTVMNKNSAEFIMDAAKRMQATNYLDQSMGKFVNGYRLRLLEAFKMDDIVSKKTKQNVDTPMSNQYRVVLLKCHF